MGRERGRMKYLLVPEHHFRVVSAQSRSDISLHVSEWSPLAFTHKNYDFPFLYLKNFPL